MARILLIEDDLYTRKPVEQLLRNLKHEVLLAVDGAQGLEMALQHRPDLIILDASVPGRDGFKVLDELRRFRRTEQTPVVLISQRGSQWDREEAARRGATYFLTKPLDLSALRGEVDLLVKKA